MSLRNQCYTITDVLIARFVDILGLGESQKFLPDTTIEVPDGNPAEVKKGKCSLIIFKEIGSEESYMN